MGSIQESLVFRVRVKLNPVIHGDAIAFLEKVPKTQLADVVAQFLQYGAMAQSRLNEGVASPFSPPSSERVSAPDRLRPHKQVDTESSSDVVSPGRSSDAANPLARAGLGKSFSAQAFAAPPPRVQQ